MSSSVKFEDPPPCPSGLVTRRKGSINYNRRKSCISVSRTIGKFTQKIIFYQEMDKDGDVKIRTSKLKDLLSSTSLPLKEVNLFSFVNTNYEGVHETAAIVPKPRARCYLLLLGPIELICLSDKVKIFNPSKKEDAATVQSFIDELQRSLESMENSNFEFLVLEVALDFLVTRFNHRLDLVQPILDRLTGNNSPEESTVARLSALKNGIESFKSILEGLMQPIKELLHNDRNMADLFLGPNRRNEKDHEEVEFLLEAASLEINEIIKKTHQMISRIDNNIGLVEFMLDSQRNKIMRMSLRLEMFGVTCGFAAAIGGVFGMNLKNHIENHVSAFTITWMTILFVSLGLFVFLLVHFQKNFSVKAGMAKKSYKVKELETVFSLMERIEREVQNDNMTREEFAKVVQDVTGDKMSPSEKDNFFTFFDHNHDDMIEMDEFNSA